MLFQNRCRPVDLKVLPDKKIEILHILFSNMIETSQKCLFDLVMLYAKVHDNKMCNAQIGEGWW